MARAFWKGSLSFGLVEIPVQLRPAIRTQDLSFTLLDRDDFSPVGYRRYNKSTGKEVPWNRVVRGYEYEPDEYVVLSDEELKRANVEATQTIEILEFVELDDIDPLYFDLSYYVEAQKKASKSYALLRETMEKTGKAAIAKVVLRTRQHVAALFVRDSVMVLSLLHYAHEIVPSREVEVPKNSGRSAVTEREIGMAERLVEGMSGKWNPSKFKDEYRDDVLALVERKVKSGETHTIVEGETEERPRRATEVMDLMPLLKRSLEEHGEKKTERRESSKRDGAEPRSSSRAHSAARRPAQRARTRTKRHEKTA